MSFLVLVQRCTYFVTGLDKMLCSVKMFFSHDCRCAHEPISFDLIFKVGRLQSSIAFIQPFPS